MLDLEKAYGVEKIDESTYVGLSPMPKPSKYSRGAYGGSVAAQALLVAIRTSPKGFGPHSLHSTFVKPVSDKAVLHWKVQVISNGKNFVNRALTASQDGEIKYFANISLTLKNSFKEAVEQYEKQQQAQDDADDDDDEPVIPRPFEFQAPYPKWFEKDDLTLLERSPNIDVPCKLRFSQEFWDLDATKQEDAISPAERRLAFFLALDSVTYTDPAYNYVGLSLLSDIVYLSRLGRALRLRNVDMKDPIHYLSVSLDHTIYFHDSDFDPRDWHALAFSYPRFSNNRLLVEAEIFNDKKVHVASVIQEGLLNVTNLLADSKL